MKKAVFLILTAIPMLITAFAISLWYLGMIMIIPGIIIAFALWGLVFFRAYDMLPNGGRIFLTVSLWIIAIAAWLSPYAVVWAAFQGGHHI